MPRTSRGWKQRRALLLPDRNRDEHDRKAGFAFLPNRLLHDGFLAALSPNERSLYLFLVLAADRNGVSFYNFETICSILELSLDLYLQSRNSLLARDLVAHDGTRFQVLSLPSKPVIPPAPRMDTEQDLDDNDPATIRRAILASLDNA